MLQFFGGGSGRTVISQILSAHRIERGEGEGGGGEGGGGV
jgi:hypothetical protein